MRCQLFQAQYIDIQNALQKNVTTPVRFIPLPNRKQMNPMESRTVKIKNGKI